MNDLRARYTSCCLVPRELPPLKPTGADRVAQSKPFLLPAIVLVEMAYLYSKGRIEVNAETVRQRLVAVSNCILYPLDEQVVNLIPTGLNIHDAIIVSTALVYRDLLQEPVAVISKDGEITRSGLIDTVW